MPQGNVGSKRLTPRGEGREEGIWKGLLEEVRFERSFKDERTSTKGGKRKSTF